MYLLREVTFLDPETGLVHLLLLVALVQRLLAVLCQDHFRLAAAVAQVLLLVLKGRVLTRTSRSTRRNLLRAYRSVSQMAHGCRVG
jgi:hypothetical protein